MKIEESVLDSIRSRPRFKIFTEISKDNYTKYLRDFLVEKSTEYTGNINSEAAIIHVRNEADPYWKPCLALRTEFDPEENKTVIRGVFGPTSAVWTFFMFLYFIFGIVWMLVITVWFVEKQIKSNDFPWAVSVFFVMSALLIATYVAAQLGRLKAKKEMQQLREFAEESILNLKHLIWRTLRRSSLSFSFRGFSFFLFF